MTKTGKEIVIGVAGGSGYWQRLYEAVDQALAEAAVPAAPKNVCIEQPQQGQRVLVWDIRHKCWCFAYHYKGNFGSKFCAQEHGRGRQVLALLWLPEPDMPAIAREESDQCQS